MAVAVKEKPTVFTEPKLEVKPEFFIMEEDIPEDDPFALYKWTVICLTMFNGVLHRYINMKKQGLPINMDYYNTVVETISRKANQLLMIKEELGLSGGLDFLGNNKFDGFEIRDGMFIGTTDNVITITSPWIEKFNPDNCYLYEVAHYIQYLAFSEELYCGVEEPREQEIPVTETITELSLWERIKGGMKQWKKFSLKLSA